MVAHRFSIIHGTYYSNQNEKNVFSFIFGKYLNSVRVVDRDGNLPSLEHLQEEDLVVRLCVRLQLAAAPPQLAQLVLQTAGQLLRVPLGLALPGGDGLHQLGLALLHQPLQLGVHVPAVLQLLLGAGLQGAPAQTAVFQELQNQISH